MGACVDSGSAYIPRSRGGVNVLKQNQVEAGDYREAMSRFAGAVHVVATMGEAGKRGTTVIAACSVSDSPPTILVCLNRASAGNDLFVANGNFSLNTLAFDQIDVAHAFSGLTGLSQDERFATAAWDVMQSGAPTLRNALAVFDCRLIEAKDVATHRVLFGEVVGLRIGDTANPLIYHARGYHGLD
nr:flavin reductase [Tianweitania sediminis]